MGPQPKNITVTMYSSIYAYILRTVQVSVCPSPTTSLKPKMMETTNINISNTTCFIPTNSPAINTSTPTVPLIIVAPAAGALAVLLLVVTTGWVCTCRIMKKRGKMEINIMQDRYFIDRKKT